MTVSKMSPWMLVFAGLLGAACGSTRTTMEHSWVDPAHSTTPYKKALVITLAKDDATRRVSESQLVGIFEKQGLPAVASYAIMPDLGTAGDEKSNRELVGAAVAKCGADAVTISRLVSAETSERWVQGSTYVVPDAYYGGFYGYYSHAYEVVSTPDYLVEDRTYVVETNLYDVASEKLVWTGISETLNPESMTQGIDSVARVIVSTLRKEGLIAE